MFYARRRFEFPPTNLLYMHVVKMFSKLTRKSVEQFGVRRMVSRGHCGGAHFLNFKEKREKMMKSN